MKRLGTACMLLLTLSIATYAGAAASGYNVSLTISPFRLFNPELFFTGELRLAPKMSIAAMLGAGSVTEEEKAHSIVEASGQYRYYLIGSFCHGMMVGADAGYVNAGGSQMPGAAMYLVGIHAGGFLGYKLTMKNGFTAEAQIGPVYVWGKTKDTTELQTLLNLNIGWSFKK